MVFSGDHDLLHRVKLGVGVFHLSDSCIAKERHVVFVREDEN